RPAEQHVSNPVGKRDRFRQPLPGDRYGIDTHAREVRNILGLAAVFDALYTAARSAKLRLRECPPSSDTDQPDHSTRRALRAGLARVDTAGAALCGTDRGGDARAPVQVCA